MSKTQILMIEDDIEDVALVKAYLTQKNRFLSSFEHRNSIQGGLECLSRKNKIDVVLLDLGLADSQGIQTFQQIHTAFPEVPLIVLSGNTDEDVALKALKSGAQDYLVKGRFDSDLLDRSIRYAMERQEQRLELESKTTALKNLSDELQKANRELAELAATDGLTRILNRRRFDELFLAEWNRLAREERPLSVILCDVDCFKAYNDTYGHPAGDRCLQQIAQAISKAVKRPADIVARYGGEEFVVALSGTDLSGAIYIAEAIREAVKALNIKHSTSPFSHQVTMSLGVVTQIPHPESSPSQLLESVDKALYKAKEQGRDRIEVYQVNDFNECIQSRKTLEWAGRLRQALQHDHFQLFAQPIQAIGGKRSVQQYEILLRLRENRTSFFSPAVFLPVAQQYNLLNRIDCWVIDRLFKKLSESRILRDYPNQQFFINLSCITCRSERFAAFVQKELRSYGLPPERFCFEIPETVAFDHVEAASDLTKALQDIQCQVALDDFGSGMTSFTHLKTIPVDYVKIDGLFVRDIGNDTVSKAIVESIHRVAKLMNLETIAEFVETQNIVDALHHMGVDYAQGHYFDHAKPLTTVLAQLAA